MGQHTDDRKRDVDGVAEGGVPFVAQGGSGGGHAVLRLGDECS